MTWEKRGRSPRGVLFRLKEFALIALLTAGFILAAVMAVDLMLHP